MTEGDKSTRVGHEIINLLSLEPVTIEPEPRFHTTWGTKTIKGLGSCVRRIIEENT